MITHEHSGRFGSRISVCENESFTATISTAKEGLFEGLSTVILEGDHRGPIFGKIIYVAGLKKMERQQIHGGIAKKLDLFGAQGLPLDQAFNRVVNWYGEIGYIENIIRPGE